MQHSAHTTVTNRLLDALPHKLRRSFESQSEHVELVAGEILYVPGDSTRDVFFPTGSIISLLAIVDNRSSLEVMLIGNEGMLGMSQVLGVQTSTLRALVQGSGGAWRMQAKNFHRMLVSAPVLKQSLDRYAFVLLTQLAQTAACTRFHLLDARLARCLLLTHDRAHSDQFHLTHAVLAQMLGVRRSGVTLAAGALHRKKLINYSRGVITIVDRMGLETVSCECYQSETDTYDRLHG